MGDTPKSELLIPDRHHQGELFLCDVADAFIKDDMASMEHPFYSISKKPDKNIRIYRRGKTIVEIHPSAKGIATIYDKDILIYCISQMIAKAAKEEIKARRIKLVANDFLVFTNRNTGGKDYEALRDSLDRLDGTRIRTNVKTGDVEQRDGFGLIDSYSIKRSDKTGRILEITVVLSKWLFNAIKANEVLTLHPDYFRLSRPLERRVYELARKHCGKQVRWAISFSALHEKTGSKATSHEFRRMLRQLVEGNHLPDYLVSIHDDNVVFRNRGTMRQGLPENEGPILHLDTYNEARIVAPGYDVYALEHEWRVFWHDMGKPHLKNADAAFIGFCRSRYQRQPLG